MLFEADCEVGGANSLDSYLVYKLLHQLTDSCRLAGAESQPSAFPPPGLGGIPRPRIWIPFVCLTFLT